MSTDFKLMMGFHGGMMILMIIGGGLGVAAELVIAGALMSIAIVISALRKRAAHWRWPGIGIKEIANASFMAAATALFAFALTPLASPTSPDMLPWFLAIAGIGVFNTANALKLVTLSEEEFLTQCGEPPAPASPLETKPSEDGWKRTLRTAYGVVFMLVWIAGVASFYFFGVGMRDGSSSPTATHTEPLTNHGHTVYVSLADKQLIDALQLSMFVGIPAVMLAGAILHFGLKVPVFGVRAKRD
ncbi:MAG: hypothetical protein K2P70_09055 [Hyphomonadaceae bacterium]|nr:hypothetical protein [Hyphomonadaceae bacterium]